MYFGLLGLNVRRCGDGEEESRGEERRGKVIHGCIMTLSLSSSSAATRSVSLGVESHSAVVDQSMSFVLNNTDQIHHSLCLDIRRLCSYGKQNITLARH